MRSKAGEHHYNRYIHVYQPMFTCVTVVFLSGKRTRNVHQSIDLTDASEDLMMQLQWYHETKPRSKRHVPSPKTKTVDRTFVHVTSCLGLVQFDYKGGVYVLRKNGQMSRFKRLLDSIN